MIFLSSLSGFEIAIELGLVRATIIFVSQIHLREAFKNVLADFVR